MTWILSFRNISKSILGFFEIPLSTTILFYISDGNRWNLRHLDFHYVGMPYALKRVARQGLTTNHYT